MHKNETRYLKLKGCICGLSHRCRCCSRHRRAAARVQACLESSASTRRVLHARGAQLRPARAATGLHMVGIRQTPPTPDGTSPRSRRPGQRWASCEQCQCETRGPRTVNSLCGASPLYWCFTVQEVLSEGYGVREWRVRTKQDHFFMNRTEFWAHASRRPPFQSSVHTHQTTFL